MKMEESNIDKAFRDKLDNYSEVPPAHLWDGIQGQMATLRRKKRIAYLSRIAAAAVVMLAFLAGWYFNDKSNELPKQSVKNEIHLNENPKTVAPQDTVKTDSAQKDSENLQQEVLASFAERDRKQPVSGNSTAKNKSQNVLPETENPVERVHLQRLDKIDAYIYSKEIARLNDKKVIAKEKTELSAEEKNIIEKNSLALVSESKSNWKMGVNFSPGYSSQVSSHTQNYAQNMTYSSSEGTGTVGGGISFQYKTGKRWSVESGVYYAQNGQKSGVSPGVFAFADNSSSYSGLPETENRKYFNTAIQVEQNQMAMNSAAGVIQFDNLPKGAEIAASLETVATNSGTLLTNGEFSQVFDFVEIPLYLRYLILDAALDVELIGGVNAGVVVGNNAFINNEYGLQYIGKTQDISPVNFSGTIGFGLNYALGKHVSLAVEPRLNYFLTSLNTNPEVDYRPYRVGFYTGVYYAF